MKYFRAKQSYCVHGDDVHLYVFPRARRGARTDSGVTLKCRRSDGSWRHYTIKLTVQRRDARRDSTRMLMVEAVTHVSLEWRAKRVLGSKRYLRLKACV